MAFLDIVNLPGLLGTETHSFKRANVYDKLDLGLAGVVAVIASVVLLLNGFTTPLVCVPASCESSNTNPNCALDWTYQSGLCRSEAESIPDASFHYVLLVVALLLLGLLSLPLYWGAQASKELFENFYYIWAKLKNGDSECKDVEWKRRMHFVLDQLKSGKTLTTRYAIYHGLALLLDITSLVVVLLYTLNFSDLGLDPLGLSTPNKCAYEGFTCSLPNRELFKWFGVLSSLVLFTKAIVNLKCLLFCLGMPGLFGRNFLIYADSLQDNFDKKIFCITTNPVLVLLKTLFVVLKLVFVVPVQWLFAFCRFYTRKHASQKEIVKRPSANNIRAEQKEAKKIEKEKKEEEAKKIEKESAAKNGDANKKNGTKTVEADAAVEGKKTDASAEPKKEKPKEIEKPKEEEKKDEAKATPLYPRPAQNWSDLFFILDSISYNIDMCDIILFMTKICPVSGLENKKVNVDISYLDTSSNTLIVSHTEAGVIENLLDSELSTGGGLQIVGWLEGPTGLVSSLRTRDNPKHLAFTVSLGSTYELVSAVYARGRMLARLQNFTFQCPQDTKKQMKKYGQNVPLSAFISQSLFQKFSSVDNGNTII